MILKAMNRITSAMMIFTPVWVAQLITVVKNSCINSPSLFFLYYTLKETAVKDDF